MIEGNTALSKTAALALLAATAIPLPAAAQQATTIAVPAPLNTVMQLSESDCKVFAGMAVRVIESMGRQTLSSEFIDAMIDFAVTKKCKGPYNIPTPRGRDVAAYNSIGGILASNGISLERIGVRQVKPVAALN